MSPDAGLARTHADRAKCAVDADALIAANDNKAPQERIRFRGQRPAWNWLRKQDERAAAALWLVARRMLPDAANDNHEPGLGGLDRREDGKARGPNVRPASVEGYLALPCEKPRLGDAPRVAMDFWWRDQIDRNPEPRAYAIKPQRDVFAFHSNCRFGFCAPAVAYGAHFLGAAGGLGKPKMGKRRGDIRRIDDTELPEMPDRILAIIEAMLSRA
ncbi:hypothetical protein BMB17_004825, partial [Escherichia coli]|nr:hypothetical protein [Escherichia coli]